MQWEVNTGSGTFAAVSNTGVYSGSTTGTLTITGATSTMNGYQYEAVFTNSAGNVTSSAAALTVETAAAPSMTEQPAAQTVAEGGTTTFTAAASGTPTPTVQWEVNTGSGTFAAVSNTGVYSGTTTGTLTITGAASTMNGYQYEAVFTNAAGSVTSSAAALTVGATTAPSMTEQPAAETVVDGRNDGLHGRGQRHAHAHRAVAGLYRQRTSPT